MRARPHLLLHLGFGHQTAGMRDEIANITRDRGRKGITWSPRHKRPGVPSSRKGPKVFWFLVPSRLPPLQLAQF